MILTCPDCATRYFVDDRRLGPVGRTVRCAGCGSSWHAQSEDEAPLELSMGGLADELQPVKADEPLSFKPIEPQDMPAPELPKAFRAKAEQRRRARRMAAAGAVWTGLGCAFFGLLFLAWLFRVDVVRVFPRAAAAYAMVRVNATGLQFEGVNAAPSVIDPTAVVVQGRVRNIVSVSAPVPMIRVALLDKRGFKLKTQILKLDASWIAPGGTQSFRTTFADPKAAAADVDVSFALDLNAAPKPLRRIQPPKPTPTANPGPNSGLSQPAPILRGPDIPPPAAPKPAAPSAATLNPAATTSAATNSAANATPHVADGLRGLDTDGAERLSPAPHG